MRQSVTGASQGVLLTREGDEWSWRDGQIEAGGFTSAREALSDYLANPPDPSENYIMVVDASVAARWIKQGADRAAGQGG